MRLISLITVPAAAGALFVAGMSPAFAGEAQGNSSAGNINETGMRGHANSICAFSGQNPERFLPPTIIDPKTGLPVANPEYEPGRTQSWGQIPKAVRDTLPAVEHPGSSCNGHTGFFAGGGSE
jgi:hypothetical protein